MSCRPEGGVPLIVSSTGFESENAFFGVSVTVSLTASYTAERSLMLPAFLAVNEPSLARRDQPVYSRFLGLWDVHGAAEGNKDLGHQVLLVEDGLDPGERHGRRRGSRVGAWCHDELMAGVAEWYRRVNNRSSHRRTGVKLRVAIDRRRGIGTRELEI